MKFNGTISGFDELERKLRDLPQSVENRVLQRAVTTAMKEGLVAVRQAAPVHRAFQSAASKKYGTLKKNLRVRNSKRDRKKGQRGAFLSTGQAFWGFFSEFGTRNQPARPWFAPAFRRSSGRIIKVLGDILGAGIEREASKGFFNRGRK